MRNNNKSTTGLQGGGKYNNSRQFSHIILMKKTILSILFAIIMLFSCCCANNKNSKQFDNLLLKESAVEVKTVSIEKNREEPSLTDSAIALLLYTHIDEAIQDYYGERTQFALYDAVVNNISRVGNNSSYNIIISVPTFHGAHNPPYGLETMTFTVKTGGIVILKEYVHKDA